MRIYDISWPMSESMTQYKNKNEVIIKQTKYFDEHGVVEHHLQMGTHSGTHIDAPSHFIKDGASMRELMLDRCIGQAFVLDCTDLIDRIMASDLQGKVPAGVTRLLLKTKNSNLAVDAPFEKEFVSLDSSAAQWIVDHEIVLVGIDYLGIEKADSSHKTHLILLKENIIIVEGLRLNEVSSGDYELCCLPLSMSEVEASPARAILIKH